MAEDVQGRTVSEVHGAQAMEDGHVALVVTAETVGRVALIFDRAGADAAIDALMAAIPSGDGERVHLSHPELSGTVAVDHVEVGGPDGVGDPDDSHPFSIRMRTGEETALSFELSYREFVRWHRRLGSMLAEHLRMGARRAAGRR